MLVVSQTGGRVMTPAGAGLLSDKGINFTSLMGGTPEVVKASGAGSGF